MILTPQTQFSSGSWEAQRGTYSVAESEGRCGRSKVDRGPTMCPLRLCQSDPDPGATTDEISNLLRVEAPMMSSRADPPLMYWQRTREMYCLLYRWPLTPFRLPFGVYAPRL